MNVAKGVNGARVVRPHMAPSQLIATRVMVVALGALLGIVAIPFLAGAYVGPGVLASEGLAAAQSQSAFAPLTGPATQSFALTAVCETHFGARDGLLSPDDAAVMSEGTGSQSLPGGVERALTTLADSSATPMGREMASVAASRFFRGVCSAPADPVETACTLLVTLDRAKPVQLSLIASQMRFVLDGTVVMAEGTETRAALDLLSAADDEQSNAADVDAAMSTVSDAVGTACLDAELAAAAAADGSDPDATGATNTSGASAELARTGVSEVTTLLLQAALAAIALGSAMQALTRERLS